MPSQQPFKSGRRMSLRIAAIGFAIIGLAVAAVAVSRPASAAPSDVVASNGWTSSADAPVSVLAGTTATISLRVRHTTATSALVDGEIYDANNNKLAQTYWDNSAFAANTEKVFKLTWSVPSSQAIGVYSVRIGVFAPGWASLLHWNNVAGHFQVSAASTTTTVKPTTTTVKPTTTTAKPTTTTVKPTTTTVKPTTTTVKPTTTTAKPVTQHFATLPVGATLPSGADCAARVRPAAEVRPANAVYNSRRADAAQVPQTGWYARVDGNFVGTTDEIIQWASCKWGIDEDIVRAQTAKESWWYQRNGGDFTTDPTRCAPDHGFGVDGQIGLCAESVGVMQVRFPYWAGAFPSASRSTAYNLDVALAARRGCFEGREGWLNTVEHGQTYAAGDIWGCVGLWFSGRWYAGGAQEYISAVQAYLSQRIWTTPGFIAG